MGKLSGVAVSGTVYAAALDYEGIAIGGLVGQSVNTVENCRSSVTITVENTTVGNLDYALNIGGLIGVGGNNVTGCIAGGKISVGSDVMTGHNKYIGGLAGSFAFYDDIALTVADCASTMRITAEGPAYCAGLIADIRAKEAVNILSCSYKNNKISAEYAAGLIYNLRAYGPSEISACEVYGTLNGANSAYGFVANAYSGNDTDLLFNGCSVTGVIESVNKSAGFCGTGFGVSFDGDTVNAVIRSSNTSVGFGATLDGGFMRRCSTNGKLYANRKAMGLAEVSNITDIVNCYSTCDIYFTNPDASGRITASGLLGGHMGSLQNCYYAGIMDGTASEDSEKSALIVSLSPTGKVYNCHWHMAAAENKLNVVSVCRAREGAELTEIYEYGDIADMYGLADTLNRGQTVTVWENVSSSLPRLRK